MDKGLNTIPFKKKKAKVIAHRGLSAFETENTLAAFIAAGNRSYYGIETDVHVTKDGKFIVIHDDTTKRVAGDDYVVEETDFDVLRKLNLFECNSGVLNGDGTTLKDVKRGDLVPPTLAEYIAICKKYDKVAVLELKNPMTKENIVDIVNIIKDLDYLKETIFISFAIDNLIYVKEIDDSLTVQFLSYNLDDLKTKMPTVLKYGMDLDLGYWLLTKELVKEFKRQGLKINVWTPCDPNVAERLVSWGVDFITTNILE